MATTAHLLTDLDAPLYMREFAIKTGYRQRMSYTACIFRSNVQTRSDISSWFRLHNETVNIWSHFIGFLIFFYNLAMIVSTQEFESKLEIMPLIIQLVSYQICMLSSTLFHTFSCHSEKAHDVWQETDHLGILTALFGTYISLLSIIFNCFPVEKMIHLSLVVAIFALVVILRYWRRKKNVTYSPKIPLKIFLTVAVYSLVPLSHWVWLHGGFFSNAVQEKLCQIFLPFVAGAIGLVFYVTRFPEKSFNSGTVDIIGSSHQVWHVMIFCGMALWYKETSTSFMENRGAICSNGILNSTMSNLEENSKLVETFLKALYIEELLHFSLEEVFNIF